MATITKFLFDTAFDTDIAAPRPAGAPAQSGRVLMTRDEFEAAKTKAYAEGRQAGEAKAAAETAALLAAATQSLATNAGKLLSECSRNHDERTRDAVAIALSAVRRLMPGLIARDGTGEIESLMRECLERLQEEPRVVVRVHDDLLDALRERLDRIAALGGFAGRLVLLADPSLGPQDARIEWADGGVERSPAATQAEITAAIDRFLNSPSAAG